MYRFNNGKAEHVCITVDSSWHAADEAALNISVALGLGVQQQLHSCPSLARTCEYPVLQLHNGSKQFLEDPLACKHMPYLT